MRKREQCDTKRASQRIFIRHNQWARPAVTPQATDGQWYDRHLGTQAQPAARINAIDAFLRRYAQLVVTAGPLTNAPGAQIRCTGFLARRYRTGITVALHVNEFDLKSETNEGN